jgi:hypothetical protein
MRARRGGVGLGYRNPNPRRKGCPPRSRYASNCHAQHAGQARAESRRHLLAAPMHPMQPTWDVSLNEPEERGVLPIKAGQVVEIPGAASIWVLTAGV